MFEPKPNVRVEPDEYVKFRWKTQNAIACSLSPYGKVSPLGEVSLQAEQSETYTLVCFGSRGDVVQQVIQVEVVEHSVGTKNEPAGVPPAPAPVPPTPPPTPAAPEPKWSEFRGDYEYVCHNDGMQRRISVKYEDPQRALPCKSYYYKDSEGGTAELLAWAENTPGICEGKVEALKLRHEREWGWTCSMAEVR